MSRQDCNLESMGEIPSSESDPRVSWKRFPICLLFWRPLPWHNSNVERSWIWRHWPHKMREMAGGEFYFARLSTKMLHGGLLGLRTWTWITCSHFNFQILISLAYFPVLSVLNGHANIYSLERSESPALNCCLGLIVSFATVIRIAGIARIRPRSSNVRCTVWFAVRRWIDVRVETMDT